MEAVVLITRAGQTVSRPMGLSAVVVLKILLGPAAAAPGKALIPSPVVAVEVVAEVVPVVHRERPTTTPAAVAVAVVTPVEVVAAVEVEVLIPLEVMAAVAHQKMSTPGEAVAEVALRPIRAVSAVVRIPPVEACRVKGAVV